MAEIETRSRIPIWRTFGRIQWHVTPGPPATLQGVRIPSAILKIVFPHILFFFVFFDERRLSYRLRYTCFCTDRCMKLSDGDSWHRNRLGTQLNYSLTTLKTGSTVGTSSLGWIYGISEFWVWSKVELSMVRVARINWRWWIDMRKMSW